MQTIQIAVVRESRYRSGDGFEVYADGGSGVIDWVHPVTSRRQLFWEGATAMMSHLGAGHLRGYHLDSISCDGHIHGTHLWDQHLQPAGVVRCEMGPFVFGRFRHAVVNQDELGNKDAAGAAIHSTVINSTPPSARRLRVEVHERTADTVRFSFEPSERLAG